MTTSIPSPAAINALVSRTVRVLEKLLILLPYLLIPPGVLVWSYLKSIGWSSLFLRSALDGNALLFFLLAALLFVVMAFVLFIAPSLLMRFHGDPYDDGRKIPGKSRALWGWGASSCCCFSWSIRHGAS